LGSGGATPLSQAGFKHTVAGKGQQLTLAAVEVHADSRYIAVAFWRVSSSFLSLMQHEAALARMVHRPSLSLKGQQEMSSVTRQAQQGSEETLCG